MLLNCNQLAIIWPYLLPRRTTNQTTAYSTTARQPLALRTVLRARVSSSCGRGTRQKDADVAAEQTASHSHNHQGSWRLEWCERAVKASERTSGTFAFLTCAKKNPEPHNPFKPLQRVGGRCCKGRVRKLEMGGGGGRAGGGRAEGKNALNQAGKNEII